MNIEILQCPKWVKNNRGLKEFFSQLSERRGQKVSFEFANNVFEEFIENFTDFFDEYKVEIETLSFKNVTFEKYVRFDNIKCTNLEFIDVHFEKGGGIKNRDKDGGIDIDKLIFRPFTIKNDFVVDIGYYANKDGFLETNNIGCIRHIKFENHKEGSGQIYFVGISQNTEGDFRNKILDKVSFQGSDLSNCYFLNAQVDKAEFSNCIFPEIRNHKYINMLDEKWSIRIIQIGFVVITVGMFYYFQSLFTDRNPFFFYVMLFFIPFYGLIALLSLNAFFHPKEYFFSSLLKMTNIFALNKVQGFHHHFGTKDEVLMNDKLIQFQHKSKNDKNYILQRDQLQQSYFSMIELYKQLKENFGKSDFQAAGNFFYSQRYIEMISVTNKKSFLESWVLNTHYFVNGFGERFIRPLVLLIATVVLFAWIPSLIIPLCFQTDWLKAYLLRPFEVNRDYVATSSTPLFLLEGYERNKSFPIVIDINKSELIQVNSKDKNGFYLDKKLENNTITTFYVAKLKDDWHTEFYYSLSHFNLPFLSENKQWFQEVSQRAVFWGWVERSLLWLFSGAFVLALFHRVKR